MVLDLQGNIVSVIQIIALLLLIIGVYPYRIRTKNRNLIMHGFLSILALTLNLVTVIVVMIPVLSASITLFSRLSILQSTIVWVPCCHWNSCNHIRFRNHYFMDNSSVRRTWLLQNMETDDTYFRHLDSCIDLGTNYTHLQYNMRVFRGHFVFSFMVNYLLDVVLSLISIQ